MRSDNPSTRNSVAHRMQLFVIALGVSLFALGNPAFASDWKEALKGSLEATYPLTHRASLSPDRITQPGVVLVIEKPGIAADPSSGARFSITYVKNGQISEQGGAAAGIFGKVNTRVFKPGEKVYVIDIKIGDDYVMLELLSCDMFEVEHHGSTRQTVKAARHSNSIKIHFRSWTPRRSRPILRPLKLLRQRLRPKTQRQFRWVKLLRKWKQSLESQKRSWTSGRRSLTSIKI